MRKSTISTLAAGVAGLGATAALLIAPAAAGAATTTAAPAAGRTAAQNPQAQDAELTFTGGEFGDGEWARLHPIGNATISGTSRGPADFTQDDGYDPYTKRWTGGNELVMGWNVDDTQFTLSDLSFANGTARGTIFGFGLVDERENLAGDERVAPATVTVAGDQVTVTSDGYNGQIVLRFTLTTRGR